MALARPCADPPATVLVVDDDAGMCSSLVALLVTEGYDAAGARTGDAARREHERIRPDLAIIDHFLPDTTGLELARQLRSRQPDLSVVLLTGSDSLRTAAEAVGEVDQYLTKPCSPDRIIRAVHEGLERHRLRAENRDLLRRLEASNAMLEIAVAERTRELDSLLELTRAISHSLDVRSVAARALDHVRRIAAAPHAALYLTDPEAPAGPLLLVGRSGRGTELPERASHQRITDLARLADHRSLPLDDAGTMIGMLVVGPSRVSDDLLDAAASAIAVALQNARRFTVEQQTVARLAEIDRAKTKLLDTVSHEFRTPLTPIRGFAGFLRAHGASLDHGERDLVLARIEEQADHLLALVEDLLSAARIETGQLHVEAVPTDLAAVVEDQVRRYDGRNACTVSLDVPSPLPLVHAASDEVHQALGNVLDNAVKFSPPGSDIEVRASMDAGGVRVAVSDPGPGMDPSLQMNVFRSFGKVLINRSEHDPGIGLGLYIANGLVTAMGGSMTIDSEIGAGTTVSITLRPARSGEHLADDGSAARAAS